MPTEKYTMCKRCGLKIVDGLDTFPYCHVCFWCIGKHPYPKMALEHFRSHPEQLYGPCKLKEDEDYFTDQILLVLLKAAVMNCETFNKTPKCPEYLTKEGRRKELCKIFPEFAVNKFFEKMERNKHE